MPRPPESSGSRRSFKMISLRLPRHWPEYGKELTGLPSFNKESDFFVWTPAEDTPFTSAKVRSQTTAQIRQALPFILEDELTEDPETLHFAYSAGPDQALYVAVTAKDRLRAWLNVLKRHALSPRALCPMTLAVPLEEASWT